MDLLSSGNFSKFFIIFGLMLVLLQTGSCVDQICRFNQQETCYAALEGKLSLQMIQYINISKLELKKENIIICKIVKENIIKPGLYCSRPYLLLSNGTVIINSVTKTDSGRYTLQLTNLQGKDTFTELEVNVEAPIGSVNVSVECISGIIWASCSSEGDSLFFIWTLNGQPHAQGYMTTIYLDRETSENLTCSIKNHFSHGEKSITINHCPGVDRICRFNQTKPCYAALGEKLSLWMVQDIHISKLELKKEESLICKIKMVTFGFYCNRPDVIISNGTVIINSVTRADLGRYTLELYDLEAKLKSTTGLQVNVEVSLMFVIVWTLQMIFLLLLLGGFHIYIRKRTSTQTPGEKQQEDIVLYDK
ncbi:pregnancy-specific beta-1-glycoprotein 7-like isoform X1 [Paramisgurnus dabryanus]|uniref:pregnancy-specific beta-1-glycoprotein 7-like isoform X1 n=1 Tax=Paramisgurnus dabryanus TaxID=90735 RepID=UPI003CCF6EC2